MVGTSGDVRAVLAVETQSNPPAEQGAVTYPGNT
jgi:hypothetical protein